MCRFYAGVLLILGPLSAMASENLIEDLRNYNNTDIADGLVHQMDADTREGIRWKFQVWYNNDKHVQYNGTVTYEQLWQIDNPQIGFLSHTFTTPDDLEDFVFCKFGVQGSERDTTVRFDVKNIQPNTRYTLQWRVLNTRQGEIAWDNMFMTHCATGYALPLGETDCAQICPAGVTHLNVGDVQYLLYANRVGTPALGVGYNGQMCYGHLVSGQGAGLNVNLNGVVYHLIAQ